MTNKRGSLTPSLVLLGASVLSNVNLGAASAEAAPSPFEIKPMPASCRLLPAELRKREATLLRDFRTRILSQQALADGYALTLKADSENLRLVADLIEVERQCCPFLQFQLTVAQESRALRLEIRGPGETRAFLETVFQLSATAR